MSKSGLVGLVTFCTPCVTIKSRNLDTSGLCYWAHVWYSIELAGAYTALHISSAYTLCSSGSILVHFFAMQS